MPANADLTWVLLLLPPLFIVLFLASIGRDWWIASQLRQHGTITDAEVIDLVKDSWRGTKNCYVEYTFHTAPNDGSKEYSYRQPITEAHHDRLQKGDRIVVQYLPANPNVSRLAGADQDSVTRDAAVRRIVALVVVWVVIVGLALVQR